MDPRPAVRGHGMPCPYTLVSAVLDFTTGCQAMVIYQAATKPSLRGSVPPIKTPRSQSISIA